MNNPQEEGESLMLKRVIVKSEKKVDEPTERKSLFRTRCKSQGKCCKMVINNGSVISRVVPSFYCVIFSFLCFLPWLVFNSFLDFYA